MMWQTCVVALPNRFCFFMCALSRFTGAAEILVEVPSSAQLGKVSLTCKLEVKEYKLSWLIKLLRVL